MASEDSFLKKLFQKLPASSSRVFVGPGDDAAVVAPCNSASVVTTDALVEGVHFDFDFCTPEEVGIRCIEVNFSDLAAQGAKPLYVLVSLAVPHKMSEQTLLQFYDGILKSLSYHHAELIGGNVSQTHGPLVISITAIGEPFEGISPYSTPQRGTSREGDWISVTGKLGSAAKGLWALQTFGREKAIAEFPQETQHYLTPRARVLESEALLRTGAVTSMMDISDGLTLDLSRLRAQSELDFVINESALASSAIKKSGATRPLPDREWWNQGDDYELLITINPQRWMQVVEANLSLKDLVHVIGDVERVDQIQRPPQSPSTGLWLSNKARGLTPLIPQGWDHFNRRTVPL